MKHNSILFIGILLIPLLSCEDKSENSIVETNTNLKIDIPIKAEIVENTISEAATSDVEYDFSGIKSYSITSNDDSGNEIMNIKKIKPHMGSKLSFSGIEEGNEINSLVMEWGYKSSDSEDYIMQQPIDLLLFENTLKDEVFKVDLDEALIDLIGNLESNQDKSIFIRLTGKCNFDINGVAKIDIPVLVESEELNFRYELF